MNKTVLTLAVLSALSGAAHAEVCGDGGGSRFGSARLSADNFCRADARDFTLAQYYEGGGYGGYDGGGRAFRYCRTWAQGMVIMGAEAARRGCLQYGPQGLHTNYDAHFEWCMSTSPGRTQRAAARANALLASCDR